MSPSTNRSDALAGTSNYGDSVFIAAPGVDIVTLQAGSGSDHHRRHLRCRGTRRRRGCTAPKAKNGGLSNGEIAARLAATADPAGSSSETGNGRLNLYRALTTPDTGSVKPQGAPGGGPFVGPYVVQAQED